MGAERWLLFASTKQANAAREYLDRGTGGLGTANGNCWLSWASPLKLEVGYSFAPGNRECAILVAREIAKRFKLRKVGGDSVGWFPDQNWSKEGEHSATATYGPHKNWVEWVKGWKLEWSANWQWLGNLKDMKLADSWVAEFQGRLKGIEDAILDQFKKLDEQGMT